MRASVASAVALVALAGAGAVYVASASGTARISSCRAVRVTGGDVNGAGGTGIAGVWVKNRGSRDCIVNARPWVRLGPFRYRVTVADARPGDFGHSKGNAERTWTLHPGQRISAALYFVPGSCDRGVGRCSDSTHAWAGPGTASRSAAVPARTAPASSLSVRSSDKPDHTVVFGRAAMYFVRCESPDVWPGLSRGGAGGDDGCRCRRRRRSELGHGDRGAGKRGAQRRSWRPRRRLRGCELGFVSKRRELRGGRLVHR